MKIPDTGFLRYQAAILELALTHITPIYNAKKAGKPVAPAHPSFWLVFTGFTEISNTLDALRLAEQLLSIAPPRSQRLKKDEYLKFVVSAYLQEVYILRERLNAYAKKVARLYGARLRGNPVPLRFAPMLDAVRLTLVGITNTRSTHVHGQRFSDEYLDLISSLAIIRAHTKNPEFDFALYYSLARGKWRHTVKSNNAETEELLDVYFNWLYPVVTQGGHIFLPPAARPIAHTKRRERPKR